MRIYLIIIIFVFSPSLSYSQTDEDLKKMWNSEIERVGNTMVKEIDSELNKFRVSTKNLTSKNYKNGKLTIYKEGESIKKIIKTYAIDNIEYIENYYFSGYWPIFVGIKKSTSKSSDKFYFDKTNLMLWITENNQWLQVDDKNCSNRWYELIENIDKLSIISKMTTVSVNEDEVELPKDKPLSKADSLELIKLKEELNKLLQQMPDSLGK